jgi:hypothetical protein
MEGNNVIIDVLGACEGGLDTGAVSDGTKLDCTVGSMLGDVVSNATGTSISEGLEEMATTLGIMLSELGVFVV